MFTILAVIYHKCISVGSAVFIFWYTYNLVPQFYSQSSFKKENGCWLKHRKTYKQHSYSRLMYQRTHLYSSDPSQGSRQASLSIDHSVQPCCSVCRGIYQGPVEALKCGHTFCKSCVDNIANGVTFSRCSQQWCAFERSQPIGTMSWRTEEQSLPGYDDCSTIAVTYNFHAGSQGALK